MININSRPGQFASKDPRCVTLRGRLPLKSSDGVEVGAFAWANLDTGSVENTRYDAGYQIGIVMPISDGERMGRSEDTVSPDCEVTIAVKGEFLVRFKQGAIKGQQVYAQLLDGAPVSGETPLAQATLWYVISDAPLGGLAIISTWRHT